jgi:entericidin B
VGAARFFLSPLVLTDDRKDITMLRKTILALAAGAFVFSVTACNTVRGAGKDVESAANAGSDAIH